jgi:hypothetical protein
MASPKVAGGAASAALKAVLDSPEIGRLIEELEATRWTGRPGYPIRTMIGLALAKSLYAIPTWTKTVALVADHWKLQRVLGCEGKPPSLWAAYRFAAKLRENGDAVERCIDGVIAGLREKLPSYGRDLAIDASDMPAYANGQRYVYKGGPERNWHTDPDASWGHRSAVSTRKGGGFYGYRLHAAVCAATDLPIAWTVETGKANETPFVAPLIDRHGAKARRDGRNGSARQGLRQQPRLRRVHGARLSSGDPVATDAGREARRRRAAVLPARRLDVRRVGSKARRLQVAVPDWRVQARVYVGRGRPTASADPSQVEALEGCLPKARLCRARVRQAQEPVGLEAAPRQRLRSGSATRRPHDPREAGLHPLASAGYGPSSAAGLKRP